ncbi:hypothetical protein [Spiroplasma endosymbiont of Lariophagus distinguendus]|nr:hypothetical protein [Spiroplasma endosymbiont of Lariophagus distinguendus]
MNINKLKAPTTKINTINILNIGVPPVVVVASSFVYLATVSKKFHTGGWP